MGVGERIGDIYRAGDVDSARQFAREVIRNRSDVTVSLDGDELVVATAPFTGRHPVTIDDRLDDDGDDAVANLERGAYRLTDGPSFDVTIHTLWPAAESAALPVLYDAARERGFVRLHALSYPTGRAEVDYVEPGAEPASNPTRESAPEREKSGVLQSVRQLIR